MSAAAIEALAASGRASDVVVVAHEVNAVTTPLLREGRISFALAADPAAQLAAALHAASPGGEGYSLDFGVYTRFNPPSFASSE
jgi:ABC-type sugar transport system substrate-binding protein